MNKRDLKKISCEFRIHASEVLNSHYGDFLNKLNLFIAFIQETDLLIEYIDSLPDTDFNAEEAISFVINSHGNMAFNFGNTDNEVITNTFKFLTSPSINCENIINIAYSFSLARQAQDMIKIFGQRVILPFVNHLQLYITNIGIDMGMDDSIQYKITVNNGGQVNLSQDNSTINAVQNNNGIKPEQMQRMIDDIFAVAKDQSVPNEAMQLLIETFDVIKDELKKPSPKRSVIQMLLNGLTASGSILGAIPVLSTKINEFAQYIEPILP